MSQAKVHQKQKIILYDDFFHPSIAGSKQGIVAIYFLAGTFSSTSKHKRRLFALFPGNSVRNCSVQACGSRVWVKGVNIISNFQ